MTLVTFGGTISHASRNCPLFVKRWLQQAVNNISIAADLSPTRNAIHFFILDCYKSEGNGVTYLGMASVTEDGTPCHTWHESGLVNAQSHPNKASGHMRLVVFCALQQV